MILSETDHLEVQNVCTQSFLFFCFQSGVQAIIVCIQVQIGKDYNAALVYRYPLLVVEGQGTHPRVSGNLKHVWVCSADVGVCHSELPFSRLLFCCCCLLVPDTQSYPSDPSNDVNLAFVHT